MPAAVLSLIGEVRMQTNIELDVQTRAALVRCYLRFARRGRQVLIERAAQQADSDQPGDKVSEGEMQDVQAN